MHRSCFLALVIVLLLIAPAHAYVGPGPGLTMIGSFFTLVGGIIVAFLMVLLWPLRLLVRRLRGRKPDDASKP